MLIGIYVFVALSQLLPLSALGWVLCSVAACTVQADKFIVHRVIFDREYSLRDVRSEPSIERSGAIAIDLPDKRLRVHVAEPELLLAALLEAAPVRAG